MSSHPDDSSSEAINVIVPGPKVRFVYHRIACSYPRFGADAPYDVAGLGGNRIPEYSRPVGNTRYTKSQATRTYAVDVVIKLCNLYGIEVLTGWWDKYDYTPWDHFYSSFLAPPNLPVLGNLRLAFMFGILRYRNPPRGFPDSVEQIRAKIVEWAGYMTDTNRYAYITDGAGRRRPMLFAWGAIEQQEHANIFRDLVMRESTNPQMKGIRQIIRERTGQTPYIILSQHNALSNTFLSTIAPCVDAFYQHEIAIPDKSNAPSQYHTITTQQSLDGIHVSGYHLTGTRDLIRTAAYNLRNSRSTASGLFVQFISGGMPQFNSDRVPNHTHGVVRAESKAQVQRMFEMYRDYAPTIYWTGPPELLVEHKWVAISTFAEWAEGTTIEPVIRRSGTPAAYNQFSDYGYDFLELVRDVFRATPWLPQ